MANVGSLHTHGVLLPFMQQQSQATQHLDKVRSASGLVLPQDQVLSLRRAVPS